MLVNIEQIEKKNSVNIIKKMYAQKQNKIPLFLQTNVSANDNIFEKNCVVFCLNSERIQ